MFLEQCKGVHYVDLGESFQTHIYLQNLASIQPRTSPLKFAASRDVVAHVKVPTMSCFLQLKLVDADMLGDDQIYDPVTLPLEQSRDEAGLSGAAGAKRGPRLAACRLRRNWYRFRMRPDASVCVRMRRDFEFRQNSDCSCCIILIFFFHLHFLLF